MSLAITGFLTPACIKVGFIGYVCLIVTPISDNNSRGEGKKKKGIAAAEPRGLSLFDFHVLLLFECVRGRVFQHSSSSLGSFLDGLQRRAKPSQE